MGAQGSTTVNFGAFPGVSDTTMGVVGQASIVPGSLVEAWVAPVATADHSADEHWVDPPRVMAGSIVNAVGFTIYASAPMYPLGPEGSSPKVYGLWTVNWVWN